MIKKECLDRWRRQRQANCFTSVYYLQFEYINYYVDHSTDSTNFLISEHTFLYDLWTNFKSCKDLLIDRISQLSVFRILESFIFELLLQKGRLCLITSLDFLESYFIEHLKHDVKYLMERYSGKPENEGMLTSRRWGQA